MPWGWRQSPFRVLASAMLYFHHHAPSMVKIHSNTAWRWNSLPQDEKKQKKEQEQSSPPTLCFALFYVTSPGLIFLHFHLYIRHPLAEHLATSCQSSCMEKARAGSFTLITDIMRSSQTFLWKNKMCSQQNRQGSCQNKMGGAVRTRNIDGNYGGCQQQITKTQFWPSQS